MDNYQRAWCTSPLDAWRWQYKYGPSSQLLTLSGNFDMKIQFYLSILSVAYLVSAAYVPSAPWSTLTPTATLDSSASATASFDGSFALSVSTISTNSAAVSAASKVGAEKRDDLVGQITDGQIQQNSEGGQKSAPTKSVVNQITDGQIQQQTKTTAAVVNQISDGQIQQQSKTTAAVINQISDGQIQQQTKTTADLVNQISDGQIQQQTKTTAAVINQISDGQVQQQTKTTASVVNQISDGQVQHQTTAPAHKSVAEQLSDGQVQHQTKAGQATQVSDGQVQASGSSSSGNDSSSDSGFEETCVSSDSLTVTLKNGVLKDSKGRIGSIVANRQFQFDGPPPQAGAIYAAGWSIVPLDYKEDSKTKQLADDQKKGENEEKDKKESKDKKKDEKKSKDKKKDKKKDKRDDVKWGKLALGKQTTFYKCLSGDFYNLYDESIGGQCSEVELVVLKAVEC